MMIRQRQILNKKIFFSLGECKAQKNTILCRYCVFIFFVLYPKQKEFLKIGRFYRFFFNKKIKNNFHETFFYFLVRNVTVYILAKFHEIRPIL